MSTLRQVITLTALNLANVPRRLGLSLVTVIGIGTVVGVLISFLSMSAGINAMATRNVRADRVVVLSSGASSSLTSSLARDAVATIVDAPGIKKDADGSPLVAAGIMVPVGSGLDNNTLIIGAGTKFRSVFPEFRIIQGRMITRGVRELVIGKLAQSPFDGLDVGERITLRGSEWTIVGRFEQNGGIWENYAVADAETMMSVFERSAFQHVIAVLDAKESFDAFRGSLSDNPSLSVDVMHEVDYVLLGMGAFTRLLTFVGFFIGGVMATGAACGGLNTLYAVVDARRAEIATLRAIGFQAAPVALSVLAEALALALVGAFLGAVAAWTLFDGVVASTRGLGFPLAVTLDLVWLGIVWALAIGFVGAVLPAIKAARVPIAAGLAAK